MTVADDVLLEEQINKHKVQNRKDVYLILGMALTLLPTYLFQAVHNLSWEQAVNWIVILPTMVGCAVSFVITYHKFFESHWLNQSADAKSKRGENEQERANLQFRAAMGYALAFNNGVFLLFVLFLQYYLLRAFDPRVNYVLSMAIPTFVLYWLAQENEKTVNKRLSRSKSKRS